ncbi:hypothetical protein [Mucilaginibacter arboris]|uniref:Uncharacterized protein n=1 Tax=Mucilaginibacter arboris TaxID=2682090 RepID=A0A7K1SUF4_9SPHI|nr:hypothetical protein [Mucilaginibacter arboris]MVN20893.1 hypothetical protein [Mucilaginibacter arboris]
MEATFKITAAEFDIELFKKIEGWVKDNKQSEIIISIKKEMPSDNVTYFNSVKSAIKELSEGKSKTFSMEELNAYLTGNFS